MEQFRSCADSCDIRILILGHLSPEYHDAKVSPVSYLAARHETPIDTYFNPSMKSVRWSRRLNSHLLRSVDEDVHIFLEQQTFFHECLGGRADLAHIVGAARVPLGD